MGKANEAPDSQESESAASKSRRRSEDQKEEAALPEPKLGLPLGNGEASVPARAKLASERGRSEGGGLH